MVEKTSQTFLEFQSEREALSEVMAAKGRKKMENCLISARKLQQ